MPYTINGYTLPSGDQPSEGDDHLVSPQKWSEFEPIGASAPGTLLTYISTPSLKKRWKILASTATKNSLVATYEARQAFVLVTPEHSSGVTMMMTELTVVRNRNTRGTSRFECWFTMVKAE